MQNLSESLQFPSIKSVSRQTARQLADQFHMHLVALLILRSTPLTEQFAKTYARKTLNNGGFNEWKQNATDLGVMGWALFNDDVDLRLSSTSNRLREKISVDTGLVEQWLRTVSSSSSLNLSMSNRIFSRLDMWLKVTDQSLKAIRRLASDWDDLSHEEASLTTTRLLQLLRAHSSKSDLLSEMEKIGRHYGLEMSNVCNPETGDGCSISTEDAPAQKEPKKSNFFSKMGSIALGGVVGYNVVRRGVKEDASAGATAAGDIAGVMMPFGGVQRRVAPSTITKPDTPPKKKKRKTSTKKTK